MRIFDEGGACGEAVVEPDAEAHVFVGVVNSVNCRDDYAKVPVPGAAIVLVFHKAPAGIQLGLKGEFFVVEQNIAESQTCGMVGKVDGIGAVGLYQRANVDGCGEHVIFSAYHIFMIYHPV